LDDPKVEAPDPELIKIHAAFGKVLHLCGAAEYVAKLESQIDEDMAPALDDGVDSCATRLIAKLELLVC
jgi:hypothetical protein